MVPASQGKSSDIRVAAIFVMLYFLSMLITNIIETKVKKQGFVASMLYGTSKPS
jgi:hypothetical protein